MPIIARASAGGDEMRVEAYSQSSRLLDSNAGGGRSQSLSRTAISSNPLRVPSYSSSTGSAPSARASPLRGRPRLRRFGFAAFGFGAALRISILPCLNSTP